MICIFNSFPAFDIRNPFLNWMDVPDDIKINHELININGLELEEFVYADLNDEF